MKTVVKSWTAVVFLLASLGSGYANANAIVDAKVLKVGQWGNGNAYIIFDTVLAEAGCSAARLEIPANHPSIKNILAIALSAKASGSTVRAASTGCLSFVFQGTTFNFPTMNTTNDASFNVGP